MREVRLIWCKVFWQHLAGFCLAKLPLNCLGLWSFVFINQSNLFYCFHSPWIKPGFWQQPLKCQMTCHGQIFPRSLLCEVLRAMSALYSPERWRGHSTPPKLGRRDMRIIPACQKKKYQETFSNCTHLPTFIQKTGELKDSCSSVLVLPQLSARCVLQQKWYRRGYSKVGPKLGSDEDGTSDSSEQKAD